jgi:hypothetical protein
VKDSCITLVREIGAIVPVDLAAEELSTGVSDPLAIETQLCNLNPARQWFTLGFDSRDRTAESIGAGLHRRTC